MIFDSYFSCLLIYKTFSLFIFFAVTISSKHVIYKWQSSIIPLFCFHTSVHGAVTHCDRVFRNFVGMIGINMIKR